MFIIAMKTVLDHSEVHLWQAREQNFYQSLQPTYRTNNSNNSLKKPHKSLPHLIAIDRQPLFRGLVSIKNRLTRSLRKGAVVRIRSEISQEPDKTGPNEFRHKGSRLLDYSSDYSFDCDSSHC